MLRPWFPFPCDNVQLRSPRLPSLGNFDEGDEATARRLAETLGRTARKDPDPASPNGWLIGPASPAWEREEAFIYNESQGIWLSAKIWEPWPSLEEEAIRAGVGKMLAAFSLNTSLPTNVTVGSGTSRVTVQYLHPLYGPVEVLRLNIIGPPNGNPYTSIRLKVPLQLAPFPLQSRDNVSAAALQYAHCVVSNGEQEFSPASQPYLRLLEVRREGVVWLVSVGSAPAQNTTSEPTNNSTAADGAPGRTCGSKVFDVAVDALTLAIVDQGYWSCG